MEPGPPAEPTTKVAADGPQMWIDLDVEAARVGLATQPLSEAAVRARGDGGDLPRFRLMAGRVPGS